jgi:hypothetical protein
MYEFSFIDMLISLLVSFWMKLVGPFRLLPNAMGFFLVPMRPF